MSAFAPQTREIDFLLEFFRRLKLAETTGDLARVEQMIDPKAVLVTSAGRRPGREAIIEHLREMSKQRHRKQIVAPKGGLVTVLVTPMSYAGTVEGRSREQVYHVKRDRIVELIDLGRTPDMVYRVESQPN